MARVVNFADSDFEPTDEELVQLSKEAFADVGERRRAALERMRAEIAELRRLALARVARMRATNDDSA